jgi:hypothetical protein
MDSSCRTLSRIFVPVLIHFFVTIIEYIRLGDLFKKPFISYSSGAWEVQSQGATLVRACLLMQTISGIIWQVEHP